MGKVAAILLVLLAGCARTSTMPLSQNAIQISVRAAPVCGIDGAQRIALRTAAVETIRRGFERFLIAGSSQGSEMLLAGGSTSSQVSYVGRTAYVTTTTTPPTLMHAPTQVINVSLLKRGDAGFENALDAKQVLGPDWAKKVADDGQTTCTED